MYGLYRDRPIKRIVADWILLAGFAALIGLVLCGVGLGLWQLYHLQFPSGLSLAFAGVVGLLAVYVYPMVMPYHSGGGR